jgi:GTP-binding protein EngB required for normal cell division
MNTNKINHSKITIGVIGQISAGKSSFINNLIGLNICPTGITKTTSSIIKIKYNNNINEEMNEEIEEEIEDELYDKIEEYNENYDKKEYKMYEIEGIISNNNIKELLEITNNNIEIIDFPGFDEYLNQEITDKENKEIFDTELYKSSLKYINECDIILYILDSAKIESKITNDMLNSLKTTSKPIVMVLSKCDEYKKYVDKNGNTIKRYKSNNTKILYDLDKIKENILKIETLYRLPCIGTSNDNNFLNRFNIEFNLKNISDIIIKIKDNEKYKFMESIINKINEGNILPFNIYKESKNNYQKYIKKINTISTGLLIAGVGGVGTILSVGLLAIPGIGPIASATTITSSLATIGSIVGGGMISGVVILSFGTGIVTLSTTTLGLGLGLGLGNMTSNILIGDIANSILNNENIEHDKISFNAEELKNITEYLDNGSYENYKNYLPTIYNNNITYEDIIFIQHDNKLFFIRGLFKQNQIKSISYFFQVV